MQKTLLIVLIVGLFNGCLFHHPHNRDYYSNSYDNHAYENRDHYYDDRDNRHYRNHGDARMNVTRHGRRDR